MPFLCLLNQGRLILDYLVAFVLRSWEQLGEREPLARLEVWNESGVNNLCFARKTYHLVSV